MGSESSRPATLPDVAAEPASPVRGRGVTPPRGSLFRALRHCWPLALALGLLGGGLVGTFLWFAVPDRYGAEIRIRVHASSQAHVSEEEIARFVRTQAAAIPSTSALESVLRRPEIKRLEVLQEERDPLTWVSNHLTVGVGSTPATLLVRVHAAHAEEAVVLVRAIAEVTRASLAQQREAALRQVADVRRNTEEKLRVKRQRLAVLENPRLLAAEKECQQARFDRRIARAELAECEKRRPAAEQVRVSEQAILAYLKEDAVGRERLHEVEAIDEKIQTTLRVSAAKERDPHLPDFYRAREAAAKRLKARGEEVRTLVEGRERRRRDEEHRTQRDRCRERTAFYEGVVQSLEAEVGRLGGGADDAQERIALREETTVADEALQNLVAEEERLRKAVAEAALEQMDEPVVVRETEMKEHVRPALLGGVGCGVLLVLGLSWREARGGRISSGRDIACGLELVVVGNVPGKRMDPTLARGQFEGGGRVGEAVDALRTVLLHDGHKGSRVLLVTSAVGGEGKTSLAALLAASLARAWRKTLLLDADLRKPQVHEMFDLPLEPGWSEVLRGESEIADVVQPTEWSRLWTIPAGHSDAHAIQALAQDGIARLFDPLKEQFDFIVLDACPILPVADALLLCPHVDTVLLAVRSGVSRLPIVQAAQQRLATLAAPLRGAVLIGPDDDLAGQEVAYPSRLLSSVK